MLSANPLITTIIPTYRRPELLKRAIWSALNQTYPGVRVCVLDNASGDETRDVVQQIRKKDNRVSYYCHDKNIGPYPNFNYGIQEVNTPFFSLLSDDDILTRNFYENALKAFQQYPDAMLACMDTVVINTDIRIISPPIATVKLRRYAPGEAVKGMIECSIPATWTGIVFRTIVRERIGLIDTNVGPNADGVYVYYAAAKLPIVTTPGIGGVLMAQDFSVSRTAPPMGTYYKNWWNAMVDKITADDKVPAIVGEYLNEIPQLNYRRIGIAQVGRSIALGDLDYATQAARGIKECGYPITGEIMKFIVWCVDKLPLGWLIGGARSYRRYMYSLRSNRLHRKYGHLVAFIKERDKWCERGAPSSD